jgi:cyclopropane-fatty-acyl-phospholipid synthase
VTLEDRVLSAGLLPDPILRRVIRSRVEGVQERFDRLSESDQTEREAAVLARFESGPVTVHADTANQQHYELPAPFFEWVLGPRLKYSCCFWGEGQTSLGRAEEAMLELTAERAGLADGQEILDLGCGWGSLALWAAERYPAGRVMAVSNSRVQKEFIEARAARSGLANIEVVTAEVGQFEPRERFDRVVSVEMLEHVRNHKVLMERLATWLRPEGRLFVHVFCHRRHLYAFDPDDGGWMSRHFFSGGVMPSWDYLTRYQDGLSLLDRWKVDGRHYAATLRTWLESLDRHRDRVMPLLEATYGRDRARLWLARWRIFFMACEETFALDSGQAYFVGHYLFSRSTPAKAAAADGGA